jgi:hypothetical protein
LSSSQGFHCQPSLSYGYLFQHSCE